MKLFSGFIGLVFGILALCFALSNRQNAVVSLWPFDIEVQAPLYLLTLGILCLGLLCGLFIGWCAMLSHRFEARRLRKDISALNDRIMNLQQTVIAPVRAGGPLLSPPKSKWRFWKNRHD